MIANYHTHTVRCQHAFGTEREYIEAAMAGGLATLGFADHTPYVFFDTDVKPAAIRMQPEELPDYAATLRALRDEYRGKIDLRIGMEVEYYPKYFPHLVELLRENGIEYIILGQHFIGNEVGEPYSGAKTDDEAILARYVSQVIEGLETGLFTYLAHPDLLNFTGDEGVYTREMRRLCQRAKELDIPLEINLLGLREGRSYPRELFWRVAGEQNAVAILGSDAHRPEHVCDPETEKRARALAAKYGVEIIETVEPRRL